MSKIGEKPLIETLLSGLSEENLEDLKSALNQGKITNYKSGLDLYTNGTLGLAHLGDLNGVYLSHHLLTFNKNSQDLGFYSVDSNGKLNPVDEYVDINELRRLIDVISAGGGSSLPEVTSADNEKVLEVIAGVWGTGRKKVNIMDAPSSTTLTDEQIAIMQEGVFINGNFLGVHNPILLPFGDAFAYVGIIMGKKATGNYSLIATYAIDKVTKVISIQGTQNKFIEFQNIATLNGKEIPPYPANTGTFTLKCVDGALTWVADAE